MPAKYKLVLRKDMRKDAAEGSKLYYASANTTGTCDVYELCDLISAQSTASSGDVKLILDELVNVMRRNLGKGEVVKVGELGSFQLQFGSTGTLTEKEFSHALISCRRFDCRSGSGGNDALMNYTVEPIGCGGPAGGSAGGEDDRPGEL